MYAGMYVCMYACVYAGMYVCMSVYMYVCMYVCMYVQTDMILVTIHHAKKIFICESFNFDTTEV